MDSRERYWQEFYNVLNGGLNCNLTETSDKPKRHSEETKRKISESNKGKKFSDKHRENISITKKQTTLGEKNSFYGKKHTDSFKEERSIVRSNGGNPKAKLVLNLDNGVYYDCAKDAAHALNVNYMTFKSWLSGRYKNKSSFIYV
jgi:group I intron endonuclease